MDSKMTPAEEVEILRACCCVAGANRNTCSEERKVLQGLAKKIGVGSASLNAMMERSESDPEFHQRQFAILKSEPTQTMATLLRVAVSDNHIDDEEIRVIHGLAKNLGVPEDTVNQLIQAAQEMSR